MEKVDLSGNLDAPLIAEDNKGSSMALNLTNIPARELFQKTRESVKPWAEFFQTKRYQVPKSIAPVGPRVLTNIAKFKGNYVFVFLGLLVFCIITSPMLLIALAAIAGACYIIKIKNQEQVFKLGGYELPVVQQYAAVGIISVPILWISGAGGAVFWIIGASFVLVFAHSILYNPDQIPFEELEMEEV